VYDLHSTATIAGGTLMSVWHDYACCLAVSKVVSDDLGLVCQCVQTPPPPPQQQQQQQLRVTAPLLTKVMLNIVDTFLKLLHDNRNSTKCNLLLTAFLQLSLSLLPTKYC